MKNFLLLLVGLFLLSTTRPALAYVDPGTAGLLFQLLYMGFCAVIGWFAFLGKPFRWLKNSLKGKTEQVEENEQAGTALKLDTETEAEDEIEVSSGN